MLCAPLAFIIEIRSSWIESKAKRYFRASCYNKFSNEWHGCISMYSPLLCSLKYFFRLQKNLEKCKTVFLFGNIIGENPNSRKVHFLVTYRIPYPSRTHCSLQLVSCSIRISGAWWCSCGENLSASEFLRWFNANIDYFLFYFWVTSYILDFACSSIR